ncbi:phosphatase PAP2 family protein [Luteimicrobium sp. NPDC057192]|uniref:phosphatase PAP2 family protein n=1 Tax=Luteimicrobium sp. NPDC057192 TaxID=3346042 RepID=UPI00362DC875
MGEPRRTARTAWWLAGAAALVFVAVLVQVATGTGLAHADEPVLAWFVAHRTPAATHVMTVVTELFGAVVLPAAVAVGCLAWWWWSRDWWRPALLAAAMALQAVLSLVLKAVIARPRPPDLTQTVPGAVVTHSFPSGHTMAAATLTTALVCLLGAARGRSAAWWWAASSGAVVMTALVATSRLYLGYHFLTDVVAGAAAGFAVGVLVLVPRRPAPRPSPG